MSDILLKMGADRIGNRVLKAIGINAPQQLNRDHSPWSSALHLPGRLIALNAENLGFSDLKFNEEGRSICIDATAASTLDDLRSLFVTLRHETPKLPRCSSVVILASVHDNVSDLTRAAVVRAIEGVIRSLAKELGPKGTTVNLLRINADVSSERMLGPLAFFLSGRSAFITGQCISIDPIGPDRSDSLTGKVVVLTGAAGGIGSATARRLHSEGAKLLLVDVPATAESGQALAKMLSGAEFVAADLTLPEHRAQLVRTVSHRYQKAHVVIHNAGITRDRTLAKMSDDQWDKVIAVNLSAVLSLTQELLDTDLINDGGRVINISSISGLAGNFGQTNYTATKAGLIAFSQMLDIRLNKRGIRANAIAPGFIETKMVSTMPLFTREAARRLSALRQGGRPEDVAEAITFLAHPLSQGIGSQVLRVCGGSFLGA